jgi:beta-glucosidase
VPPEPDRKITEMSWEVAPDAFLATIIDAKERYAGELPVYITENGAAFADEITRDGKVHDRERIEYLRGYLGAILDAIEAGVDVKGYFVWSLLDNFEWGLGFSKRFGLVHVDYATLERRKKDSFDFYGEIARGGALVRN